MKIRQIPAFLFLFLFIALPAKACSIGISKQLVVVTGIPASIKQGSLCVDGTLSQRCEVLERTDHNTFEWRASEQVVGLIWFGDNAGPTDIVSDGVSCSRFVEESQTATEPWIIQLLATLAGLVSGVVLMWLSTYWNAAIDARKTAHDWREEYRSRVMKFRQENDVSIYPKPKPFLKSKNNRKFDETIANIIAALNSAGPAAGLSTQQRGELADVLELHLRSI